MKVFKTATLKVRNADGEFVSFPALRGETSYDIAVANGYEGTQEEWLNMMTDENGWVTRYYELEESKANKKDVYTAAQVDELLAPVMVDAEEAADTGSYHAFVAAVNEDTVSAAFGKNNEDLIRNVGRQMAMYAWFKGEDKIEHSFDNLMRMSTLNDMTSEACSEIIESDNLYSIVKGNEYAKNKVFGIYEGSVSDTGSTDYNADNPKTVTINVSVTDKDLLSPFKVDYIYSPQGAYDGFTITINGVELASGNGDDEIEIIDLVCNWGDYNITSAGVFDIVLSIHGHSQTAISSSRVVLTLYKAKPSYGESEE